ncbi:hypothetical protein BKA83DRAFT_4362937 [Pisolithus microcarpus]|nr:hypothetical protein BKA83DRAFT_4362937 [Pisolithus microcarpus]
MSSVTPAALMWGPGFIGLTVGLALYGVSTCQYLFYVPTFRNDKRLLKSAVFLVFALDTFNTIALISFYSRVLIFCRGKTSYACTLEMPWDMSSALGTSFTTAFFVQCFYAHRVWIIGSQNKLLTGAVLITALLQFGFGIVLLGAVCHTGLTSTLFVSPFSPINAFGSAICDAIITTSIYFYLRSSPAGLLRKETYIQKLNFVFVRMGLVTCLSALAMAILYYQDQMSGQGFTAAPGAILGKTYANSMLAVLNARKGIRDHQQAAPPLEIPTLPSIH